MFLNFCKANKNCDYSANFQNSCNNFSTSCGFNIYFWYHSKPTPPPESSAQDPSWIGLKTAIIQILQPPTCHKKYFLCLKSKVLFYWWIKIWPADQTFYRLICWTIGNLKGFISPLSRGLSKAIDQYETWRDPRGPFLGKVLLKSASPGPFKGQFRWSMRAQGALVTWFIL